MLNELLEGWQPMETAPKDGTAIQARIPGHGSDNVIAWEGPFVGEDDEDCYTWVFVDDREPPDSWDDGVCWASNSNGEPSVQPDAWKLLPSNDRTQATAAAPELPDETETRLAAAGRLE